MVAMLCVCSFEMWFDLDYLQSASVDDEIIKEEKQHNVLAMLHQVCVLSLPVSYPHCTRRVYSQCHTHTAPGVCTLSVIPTLHQVCVLLMPSVPQILMPSPLCATDPDALYPRCATDPDVLSPLCHRS